MINHLLNGLGAVGNVIDLPGSSVRDTLAGKNPVDQYLDPLGYHAESNRTSGRDLARHYGMAGPEDTWGNFAGGLAVEAATDPLNLVGGHILKLAKKAVAPAVASAGRAVFGAPDPMASANAIMRLRRQVTKVVSPAGTPPALDNMRTVGPPLPPRVSNAVAVAANKEPTILGFTNVFHSKGRMINGVHDTPATNTVAFVNGHAVKNNGLANVADVAKHEMIHALTDVAANSADITGLPPLIRIPAMMHRSSNKYVRGAGRIAEELVASSTGKQNSLGDLMHPLNMNRYVNTWRKWYGVPEPLLQGMRGVAAGYNALTDPVGATIAYNALARLRALSGGGGNE